MYQLETGVTRDGWDMSDEKLPLRAAGSGPISARGRAARAVARGAREVRWDGILSSITFFQIERRSDFI